MSNRFLHVLLSFTIMFMSSFSVAGDLSQYPLFLSIEAQPKVMLSMSNDHQLFVKAYTDYTDLNEDGLVDTTYTDDIDYFGYFESNQCYKYNTSAKIYKSQGLAAGTNSHSCTATNNWSGNFLNWATMTRMDIIRKTLYGGLRSKDNTSKTILERAYLPNDVHAFSKVFSAGSQARMNEFTPFSRMNISICNVTFDNDSSQSLSGKVSTSSSPPIMRVSRGKYPRWAASNGNQCNWNSSASPSSGLRLQYPDPIVRVKVCDVEIANSDCLTYPNGKSKPVGILQQNSGDNSKKINFGLITGSYQKNKSGGVLRKNILPMVGNSNFDDEYNEQTGVFNYLDSSLSSSQRSQYAKGIIQTLDSLRIAGWAQGSSSYQYNCNSPGILNISNGQCVDWGNPLSEIFLETLRYFSGKAAATPAFNANDTSYIPGLLSPPWEDPISADNWCADLSTIAISTGLNSFDTDQLSNDINLNTQTWINKVGTQEGISGSYLVGKGSVVDNKRCSAKQVNNLSDVQGICPELPSLQGGYHLAGMAYYARTTDIRPDRDNKQIINSYGVSLAEGLPKFDIPVGSNIMSILPSCEARNNSSTQWRACSLADLRISELNAAGTKGAFDMIWEDSSWGNDYDLDGVSHISFCVGSACDVNPGAGKLKIDVELREIGAGHGLRFGYVITGTTEDGIFLPVHRPAGYSNFSYTTSPAAQYRKTKNFSVGSSTAKQLKNPLWYMTKYGNFTEADASANLKPDLQEEWDSEPIGAPDGVPDAYFKATNPAQLQSSLNQVFASIASREPTAASISNNSSSLRSNSKIYQARFNSENWSGQLLSYQLNSTTGQLGALLWDAADLIPAPSARNIITYNSDNSTAIDFKYQDLGASQKATLSSTDVDYLRGSRANEGTTYRTRGTILGDIVNSSPLFASNENFNFTNLNNYTTYLFGTTNSWDKGSRAPMLYAGANDGMLHAFIGKGDTGTCDISIKDCEGEEAFAYIPKAMYPNIGELVKPSYQHHYFVDSAPTYSDAYIAYDNSSSAKRWGSVLVGTLGAGGKGIFALDISDPMNFTKNDVLWDLDNTNSGMADLGNTFSKVSIVKMANGKWAAIIGNGYNSDNHKAALYILDLETGAVIRKIMAGDQGNSSKPNGLSTPIVIDQNGDNIADAIYAGDLYGNMWKFDVSNVSAGQWKTDFTVASVKHPLFTACSDTVCTAQNLQPITVKPEVIRSADGNLLVLFGTGKYFEIEDKVITSQINSYYSVKDTGVKIADRDELQRQEIITATSQAASSNFMAGFRITTNNPVLQKKGWFLDFNDPAYPGERVVANSLVRNSTVIFPTMIPDSTACSQGGDSFLMLLDSQSGARLAASSFDFNNDGLINEDDQVKYDSNGDGVIDSTDASIAASGRASNIGIINTPSVVSDKLYVGGSSGGAIEVIDTNNTKETGRMSWTQLK